MRPVCTAPFMKPVNSSERCSPAKSSGPACGTCVGPVLGFDREQGGEAGELAGREAGISALGQRVVDPAGAADAAVGLGQARQDPAGDVAELPGERGRFHRTGGVDLVAAEEEAERRGPGRRRERHRFPDRREAAGAQTAPPKPMVRRQAELS